MSATAPAGLGQLKQITMAVRDVGRATEFYRDTLGVPFLFAAGPTLSFFDLAGIRLMLSLPEAGIEPPGSVLYFATDDIGRTHCHDAAAAVAALGPHVDDPVRQLDHVEVVLDDHERVPVINQPVEHADQFAYVFEMQPGRRFIEHVQPAARLFRGLREFARDLETLRFAA